MVLAAQPEKTEGILKPVEADAIYSWKTAEVLLAMIIVTTVLIVVTLSWLKRGQNKKGWKKFIFPILLYLFSPWIQNVFVKIQEYIFNAILPKHNLAYLNFAGPLDKLITFGAPPIAAIIISYLLWLVIKKNRKYQNGKN